MTKEESKALITLCVDEGVKQGIVKAHEFEELLDFLDDCDKQHSLPSNLFEAKHAFSEERFPDEKMAPLRRAARIGYEAGAKWDREQMMQEAVEIEVWNYSSCTDLRALPLWGIDKFNNLEDGDKVRVIVLPKEEEK